MNLTELKSLDKKLEDIQGEFSSSGRDGEIRNICCILRLMIQCPDLIGKEDLITTVRDANKLLTDPNYWGAHSHLKN